MSTILINTLTGTSTAGSIAVTGEGGSTTTNLQQGLTKVWHNQTVDGSTINDSFNVSSLTDYGAGNYQININSNMSNGNYSGSQVLVTNTYEEPFFYLLTTSSYRSYIYDGAYVDCANVTSIVGDLA
tara:strand:- start:438 stop:818 length:381 start_codon:yes stop_codon:yes gene_type:complete